MRKNWFYSWTEQGHLHSTHKIGRPKAAWKTILSASLFSESVSAVMLLWTRRLPSLVLWVNTKMWEEGAPLISHEISRARRLIMDKWRVHLSRGEPRKTLRKDYRRALCTADLGFHWDAEGKTCKKGFLPYFSFLLLSWLSVSHNQTSMLSSFSFSTEGLMS